MMKSIVDISIIISFNYILPCIVSLESLYLSKNKNNVYNINIILIESYPCEEILSLLSFDKYDFKINLIRIKKDKKLSLFEQAMFLKLNLDKLLPDLTKTLFLDVDLIVCKDLSDLYNTNISEYYIGAIRDIYPAILYEQIGEKYNKNYFNVGVMLLNLDLIRQKGIFEKARNLFKNYLKCKFPEQDLLNNIIQDQYLILSPIYNWIISNKFYTKRQLQKFYKVNETELKEQNIVIIHYAGFKPWDTYGIPYDKFWMKYYKSSIFKKRRLKKRVTYKSVLCITKFFIEQWKILKNKELYTRINMV